MNLAWIKYYNETLGINFFPKDLLREPLVTKPIAEISLWRDERRAQFLEIESVQCDLLFVSHLKNEDQASIYSEPHWTLFGKMRNAMGLANIQIKVLEHIGTSENELFHDILKMKIKALVIMKDSPELGELKSTTEFKFLETYLPQTLSDRSELKKDSWNDLQKIMKIFKN